MNSYSGRAYGWFRRQARDDDGATAVEYGLMVGLLALVIVAGVTAFGNSVKGLFALIISTAPFN